MQKAMISTALQALSSDPATPSETKGIWWTGHRPGQTRDLQLLFGRQAGL